MHRELIHLYGPFAINTFGLFIIIGLIIFSTLVLADPKRKKIISADSYWNALATAIFCALIGGRLLFVITHWNSLQSYWHIFAIWQGGFSLLGAVAAVVIYMPFYFRKKSLDTLALLDLAVIYAPLLQAIARIGCFFAGCCFGAPTLLPLGIFNPECPIQAYMHKPLHPTQLYSAGALFIIFLALYFVFQKQYKKPGQLLCIYLILISAERFIIDFWRGDREFFATAYLQGASVPQLSALAIGFAALAALYYFTFIHKPRS